MCMYSLFLRYPPCFKIIVRKSLPNCPFPYHQYNPRYGERIMIEKKLALDMRFRL